MSGRRKRQLFGVSTETACTPRKVRKGIAPDRVRKLTDICAKYVAETFPYEHVDNSLQNIPEPIQERIVYWAFPQNENDIALYSSTNCSVNAANKQPFQQGIKLVESESVSDVLQIGMEMFLYFLIRNMLLTCRLIGQYLISVRVPSFCCFCIQW